MNKCIKHTSLWSVRHWTSLHSLVFIDLPVKVHFSSQQIYSAEYLGQYLFLFCFFWLRMLSSSAWVWSTSNMSDAASTTESLCQFFFWSTFMLLSNTFWIRSCRALEINLYTLGSGWFFPPKLWTDELYFFTVDSSASHQILFSIILLSCFL